MLILSRRTGEAITIGDDVELRILDVKGRQVRIGITAPAEVIVHREEVAAMIKLGIPKPKKTGAC